MGHVSKVPTAAFTNSQKILTGSHDRTIKIWDLCKGYCVRTIFTLSSVNGISIVDSDGDVFVSGHLDSNLRVLDARSGGVVKEIVGVHGGQVTGVEVFGGNRVLTTSRDHSLRVIDLRTFEVLKVMQGDTFRVGLNWSRSCWSPDGQYVASGSADGNIWVWNANSGIVQNELKQSASAACAVVWHPQGLFVYSAETAKNIMIWGTDYQ